MTETLSPLARLAAIRQVIINVDDRCLAADGPVTPTLQEMTQPELSEIYKLAGGLPNAQVDPALAEAPRLAPADGWLDHGWRLAAFADAVLRLWRDGADIDGCDLEEALIKSGMAVERPATAADCESTHGQDFDVQLGDPWVDYKAGREAIDFFGPEAFVPLIKQPAQ